MADIIKKATNKFTKGLVMDFSPENTSNELLTNALNATLLTFNGNELSLQNDMGNARVETAFLPEGYIPVGTCEYGGIIYIVSYNPLENKSLIGCFPSPERNISNDELGEPNQSIDNDTFVDKLGNIKLVTQYKILKNDKLNPGDKFLVSSTDTIYGEFLKDLLIEDGGNYKPIDNPRIALNIVSIDDSGKITYLDSYVRKYEKSALRDGKTSNFKYHILGAKPSKSELTSTDIDAYRNTVCSGYNVFRSKTSGKLAILAELVTIDSYDVSYSIDQCRDQNGNSVLGRYDIIIHTDVTPAVNSDNYLYIPKLKYYYLRNSQGNLVLNNKDIVQAFDPVNPDELSSVFLTTKMNEINSTLSSTDTVLELGDFNLPKVDTYHEMRYLYKGTNYADLTENLYTKFPANSYIRVRASQIQSSLKELDNVYNFKFYHIVSNALVPIDKKHTIDYKKQYYKVLKWYPLVKELIADYTTIPFLLTEGYDVAYEDNWFRQIDRSVVYGKLPGENVYLKVGVDTYLPLRIFIPNSTFNNIETMSSWFDIDKESPIFVYKSGEFLPETSDGIDYKYESLKFASIQIPNVFPQNDLKFPFVYDFTLVPCMDYGKLDHLAVSHRIDFNKFDDFTASKFNTWKYHIDGNQLTLTFGAEVYDTFEENKVDALIVEFYDLWGFVGSIEINDRKSYSGTFTKLISLNTYDALGIKKITGNAYTENYKHNIHINYDGSDYICNDKAVHYKDHIDGWEEWDNDSSNWIPLTNSDCGVLYSNILYGVKTYLRTTDSYGVHTFIPSENFFLYTFPIYNEYFYKENNFNNLHYPKLNLSLSYKLEDKSDYTVYDHPSIYMGYLDTLDKVKHYLSGDTSDTEFSTVKYYTYNGSTKLFLELGLHKDYNNFNIKYVPTINKFFTCDLLLVGLDSGTSYTVKSASNLTTPELILNYISVEDPTNTIFSLPDNKFNFDGWALFISISKDFQDLNFINSVGTKSIDIIYNWLVGYRIDVTDIVTQQVPATTICALFHQNEGKYNYEDFNIKFLEGYSGDLLYMQKYAFYNQCTDWSKIRFGIAEQILHDINSTHPFNNVWYKDSETYNSNNLGVLNRHLMSDVLLYIGKLTFCMPHLHSLDKNSGTNFVYTKQFTGDDFIAIANDPYRSLTDPSDGNGKTEEFRGTSPTKVAYDTTWFSMGCITKETYYGNKFISTYGRRYTRFIPILLAFSEYGVELYFDQLNTPKILENVPSTSWVSSLLLPGGSVYTMPKFNSRLVKTMSSIYGYNPDYNKTDVKLGTVNIVDNKVSFISHLIVLNAKLNFVGGNTFNDFVSFGDVIVSTYIQSLSKFSGISTADSVGNAIPQLSFKPNLKLCGSDENVLLTSLTYNIPKPKDIDSSLSFGQLVAVKHSDGTHTFISGTPNSKALYGWDDTDCKLVELDVRNYTINTTDGTLTLKKPYRNTVQLQLGILLDGADKLFLNNVIIGKLQQLDVSVNITGIPTANIQKEDWGGSGKIQLQLKDIPLGEILTLNSQFKTGGEIYPHGAKLTANIKLTCDKTVHSVIIGGNRIYNGGTINDVEFTNLSILIVENYMQTGPFSITLDMSNVIADITPPDQGPDIVSVIKTPVWSTRPLYGTVYYEVLNEFSGLRICYTSLTVNDLEYDGVNQNHRLFIRNLPAYYPDVDDDTGNVPLRLKIYYRPLNDQESWKYKNKDYNVLLLKTGPGFDFETF